MLRTVLTASRTNPPFLESIGPHISLPLQALERERASNVRPEQMVQYISRPGATMTAGQTASSASVNERGSTMQVVQKMLLQKGMRA